MAEWSSSGWTGFVSPYARGAIVPSAAPDKAETLSAAQSQSTDQPGVVSSYARGGITPALSPSTSTAAFTAANDNAPALPSPRAAITVSRPPAPRLEMRGPIASHVRADVRAQMVTQRNEAARAAAIKAQTRMAPAGSRAETLRPGEDFRRAGQRIRH